MRRMLLVLIVLVFLAHQDFWNWTRVEPLLFGFFPIGLWYHAVYTLLASALMVLLVRVAWPKSLEEFESRGREDNPR